MQTTQESLTHPSVERYHGLDAARAIALFIGIFHHGIESFISYAKWDWITQDSQESFSLDVLFYVSHVFRMQTFFLMSGFFVHLLINRFGVRGFIVNRVKRLVIPFVVFWPILYFTTYHLWAWGIQYLKNYSHTDAVSMLPDYMIFSEGFPLMHLWFLYFLVLFCTGVIISRPLIYRLIDKRGLLRSQIDKLLMVISNHWWGSLALGLFMIAPMLGMKDGFGVDTSASGLIPRPAPFVLYGLYFTLGWFIYRQPAILKNMERFRLRNLIISLVHILVVIILSLAAGNPEFANPDIIRAVINGLYAFASITAVFSFVGYMMVFYSRPNHHIRYLSDASYWGYLIHLPVVGFFQILVASYDMFWGLKLMLIFIPSMLILFVSYKGLVRNSSIGVLLNGVRKGNKAESLLRELSAK